MPANCLKAGCALGVSLAFALVCARATETVPASPVAILQELRSFNTVATILHVAAHPDDENTSLITYFARGRGYRTAYLSLTRGDGGQNEIGPEFDEKLGVARTQELLAARRLDGGRQFFTRAIDFGFSKTPEETLKLWDRDQVLADVVRVIRQYRPDVVVTRFPIPPGSGGHGHHTASGILGVEAFKLAGDPKAYPEQLAQGLTVWQPKRVAWNGGGGGRGGGLLSGPTVTVDIGGDDPVTGESFGAIAGRSRAMHITQGFGNFGGRGGGGPNPQTFTILGGEPATKDLFDGIDTTWARVPNGAEIGSLTDKAIADFKQDAPAASVPALLAIRAKLATLAIDPVVDDKRAQLDRILQACLGLSVETIAPQPEVVPGEPLNLRLSVSFRSDVPVRWVETRARGLEWAASSAQDLHSGQPRAVETVLRVPVDLPMTQPYWLRADGSSGIFRVDDPKLIGTPENPPALPVQYVFEVNGQKLIVHDEPVFLEKKGEKERRRRVDIIPPVSLHFASDVSLFLPGSTRPVAVEVIAARANQNGEVRLEAPAGWKVSPATQPFRVAKVGEKASHTFNVTAPARQASERLTASVTINGRRFSNQRMEINYAHLPFILLQPEARARAVCVDLAIKGRNAGYVPGAGDNIAQALTEMGYNVKTLTAGELTPEKLAGLDTVVVGVRAFNVRKDLARSLTNLLAYVENGGTVVVQYNRPDGLGSQALGPYPFSIQGSAPKQRVTDELAPVTFLAPDHAALTTPNRIGQPDFDGWFQERGAYFPSSWDKEHYEPVLAMSDPGEEPLQGGILVAKHGKGYYVYTGVAFFRQLPAGVPGAYRLFANLVSLGK
ncbi:MAG TPA: PIG-L family deacetylase [Verrucomicrobiae bacterium]|nr:PIG-L family deacetylase [Verrucomicrobiae bacterium]